MFCCICRLTAAGPDTPGATITPPDPLTSAWDEPINPPTPAEESSGGTMPGSLFCRKCGCICWGSDPIAGRGAGGGVLCKGPGVVWSLLVGVRVGAPMPRWGVLARSTDVGFVGGTGSGIGARAAICCK